MRQSYINVTLRRMRQSIDLIQGINNSNQYIAGRNTSPAMYIQFAHQTVHVMVNVKTV